MTRDDIVEAGAKAGFEHIRSQRPDDHGPYATWDDTPESYREYLCGIEDAALTAMLPLILAGVAEEVRALSSQVSDTGEGAWAVRNAARLIEGWTP